MFHFCFETDSEIACDATVEATIGTHATLPDSMQYRLSEERNCATLGFRKRSECKPIIAFSLSASCDTRPVRLEYSATKKKHSLNHATHTDFLGAG